MPKASHFDISIDSFHKLTGCELSHFTAHVMRGDAWGTFMKLVTLIEATAKRAIAIRLGVDPASDGAMHLEFHNALLLCRDARLISEEAFAYANYMRHVRNDLAHSGGALDLDVQRLRGAAFYKKYEDKINSFVSLEGTKLSDGVQPHLNVLLLGCIAFISLLAKELLGETWLVELSNEHGEGIVQQGIQPDEPASGGSAS